ncbi:TerB N-terminal domain-containing protein [Pallidibacillus thermolactis]|jgi:TM2 domain-containing membrane protein YozV|uniref:TerB N-terminal domain-containing protein n=1 Tax=Pallidibacillus thermolactis TaxID=251051 RepID=UPI002E1CA370|nr:TerB N-terminal domain-containing protein [Pallidibacillus thermolactis subsp. kokeshiiformis]
MKKEKSLTLGYVLAFFLGGIGAHLFYYRKYARGVLYLLFSWTYIPIFLGWFDMIFIKKWTNQINEEIQREQEDESKNSDESHSVENLPKVIKTKLSIDNQPKNSVSDSSNINKVMEFLKESFTFYDESKIILPKYSHLKADKSILEHLEITDETTYEESGIRLSISVSTNSTEFTRDSLKYAQQRGFETKEIPFQSYWPTFRDLNQRQLKWYFYWREQALKGNFIEIDLSYIFIFVYELLNYSFNRNAAFNVSMLVRLLDNYRETYPKLEGYLKPWIADMLYELGEVELAEEWDEYKQENVPTLYNILKEETDRLEKISISVWKPYIRNYSETVFFQKHKNKIYKRFKQSIPLIQEAYQKEGTNLLDEWFEIRDSRKVRSLFRNAVVERLDMQIHVRYKECRPTKKLYDVVSNLFRLAENVVRIEEGEKRQIKVNEEVLPPGMKEKMLAFNKRFKTVQTKNMEIKGSSIPAPPNEFKQVQEHDTTIQEIHVAEIEFDWDEINKKEEELRNLHNKIEDIESSEEVPTHLTAPLTSETDQIQINNNESQFIDIDENLDVETPLNSMFAEEEEGIDEFVNELTDVEKEFLLLFEENEISVEQAKDFAKKRGKMLGVLITEINEKGNEYLDDILLEENENSIKIIEEFEEIVATIRGEIVEN